MKLFLSVTLVAAAFSMQALAECPKPFNRDLRNAKQRHDLALKEERMAKEKCEKNQKGCPNNKKTSADYQRWFSKAGVLQIAAANLNAAEKACAAAEAANSKSD